MDGFCNRLNSKASVIKMHGGKLGGLEVFAVLFSLFTLSRSLYVTVSLCNAFIGLPVC